ncbi:MAG: hypothetical protein CTY28_12510 [Hyphomicrobium sp.]|nr:MAG: hypothetical protein CTY28_12510 [Hyphomicrobium sp.]
MVFDGWTVEAMQNAVLPPAFETVRPLNSRTIYAVRYSVFVPAARTVCEFCRGAVLPMKYALTMPVPGPVHCNHDAKLRPEKRQVICDVLKKVFQSSCICVNDNLVNAHERAVPLFFFFIL